MIVITTGQIGSQVLRNLLDSDEAPGYRPRPVGISRPASGRA